MIVYVERDNGVIVGVYAKPQAVAAEAIDDQTAEVQAYLNPVPPTQDEIDTARINRALLEDGSVVRAMNEVMFDMFNEIRLLQGNSVITKQQYVDFLKAKIRT